jgi:hypothetical protein
MISTTNTKNLPNAEDLRILCKSISMIEAILMPEWESRYYSFVKNYMEKADLFHMKNGCGDDMFIVFADEGTIIKGFAHESSISPYQTYPLKVWPGILESVPEEMNRFLSEVSLEFNITTFCLWQTNPEDGWQHGELTSIPGDDDTDGSKMLLAILDGNPETYRTWAFGYYGISIRATPIREIYNHMPLSKAFITQLNPERNIQEAFAEARDIGYPISTT